MPSRHLVAERTTDSFLDEEGTEAAAQRTRADAAAQRQDQAAQAAALECCTRCILRKKPEFDNMILTRVIARWNSSIRMLVGIYWIGYKDYHVFRNGKLIHVRYYGNLHEKNFKSKEAWNAFHWWWQCHAQRTC